MKKFIILMSVLFLIGCATIEEQIAEMRMEMVAPWADDKEIMLDPCPGCFHLGPLSYDDMVLALADI